MRALLVKRHKQFIRGLTEKLMTYALGRELGIGDRPSIDAIVQKLRRDEKGLRDLLRLIVTSETFQNN
ncbi:MAG TPA: DUF1585 domain-containing protein [Verrucomicrobiales bacterium]|nr:DUF1585 domain-containing protein [Verrucomicrobiales bacterium]